MLARSELAADLFALGLGAGDVVMVHASVRAIGEAAGGPDEIHLAIKEVIGAAGTMVMYAGCPRYVDEVGRGNLTPAEETLVLEKLPPFDARTARAARDHGVLAEFFRSYPGTRVNDHPARFAAWGRHAERLCATTPWDYAFGADSPLERFLELDGKILLLGADHDNVTFLHYVEHVGDFPGKRIARFKVPVLEQGKRVWRDMAEVDSSGNGAHAHWPERFFGDLVDGYLAVSGNPGGQVGGARCHLFSARGLLEFSRPLMERIARDRSAAGELWARRLPGGGGAE